MFKPTRALPLMALIAVTMLASFFELIASDQIYIFLKSPEVTEQWLEKSLAFWTPISKITLDVQSVVNALMLVAIVIWLRRVVINAGSLDIENFKTKPSAALWGSLVPVLNFFYPFYLVRKTWLSAESNKKSSITLLVIGWWFASIIELGARSVWSVANANYNSSLTPDRGKLALVYAGDYLTQISFLVLGALTLIIASKLNRAQHRKALAAGLTTVPLKADLVTFSGFAASLLSQICLPVLGLVATVMIYGFVWHQFGFWGSIAAFVLAPLTFTLVPWYAAFAKQDWSLVAVSYLAGIVLFSMHHLGVWLADSGSES